MKDRSAVERRLLFRQGFGAGAMCSVIKHENEPDYMDGWRAGREAYMLAAHEFREKYGLPEPSPLRAS